MRYMLLIYSNEADADKMPQEEGARIAAAHRAVMEEAAKRGIFGGAEPLKPTATATTIRVKGGEALISDGPFAETKEQLAGYYILDCKDLNEAIDWAAKIPTGCKGGEGCIEIRPIAEMGQLAQRAPDNTDVFAAFRRISFHFTRPRAGETGERRMEYLLLLYESEKRFSQGYPEGEFGEYEAFGKQFAKSIKGGNALNPTSEAVTVKVRDGKRLTTDGPFAETKEQLGGYYLVEARDRDEAIGIAEKIPAARFGSIEVRPILKFS